MARTSSRCSTGWTRCLRKLRTNVWFESNGYVIWGMNSGARRPTFCEMGFMNYGFDSEPRIIECYISSMAGLQPYWAHGLVKEGEVRQRDIELAIRRKRNYELDLARYTHN